MIEIFAWEHDINFSTVYGTDDEDLDEFDDELDDDDGELLHMLL